MNRADKPSVTFRFPGGEVVAGPVPKVVGVLSTLGAGFMKLVEESPCDIIELRVDQLPSDADWIGAVREIEKAGRPVIVTIRLKNEGGGWKGKDADRRVLFERALEAAAAVDVELRSEIVTPIAEKAKELGKVCIISYHDFNETPPFRELKKTAEAAERLACIAKITTMIRDQGDRETLLQILCGDWKIPRCVMGMGALGSETRIGFARMGSCLTYGYLDKPSAPGQFSAAKLVERLRRA